MHAAYDFYLCIKYFIHMTIFIFYACLDRLCLKFKWTSAFANKDQKKGPSGGMKLFGSERFTQNPVNFNVSLTQEGQVQLRHQQVPCRDRRGGWERRRGFGAVCQDIYEGESVCVCVCVLILVHFTVVPCLLFENICGCSARNYNINQRVHLYFCVLCTCRCIYCMSDLSYHARPTILPTIYTVSKTQNVNMNGSYLYIFNLSNHNSLMIHWPQLSWLVYTGYPHWVWQAANAPVKFKKLNPKRTREDLVPAEGSEPEEDENSPQDAEPVTGIQEWMPKTLGLVLYIISNIIRIHINIWYLYICMHSFELYRTNQSKSCCVRH